MKKNSKIPGKKVLQDLLGMNIWIQHLFWKTQASRLPKSVNPHWEGILFGISVDISFLSFKILKCLTCPRMGLGLQRKTLRCKCWHLCVHFHQCSHHWNVEGNSAPTSQALHWMRWTAPQTLEGVIQSSKHRLVLAQMSYKYWLLSFDPSGGHRGPTDPVTWPCWPPSTYDLNHHGFKYSILSVWALN